MRLVLIPLSIALCLLAACALFRAQPAPLLLSDGGTLGSDAESARQIVRARCGPCHHPDLPGFKPEAVKVFDTTRTDWASTMSLEQLHQAPSRLSASELEERQFARFIEEEVRRRRAIPSLRSKSDAHPGSQ